MSERLCVVCQEPCRTKTTMPDGRKVRVHDGQWCLSEYILIDRLLSRMETREKLTNA